ncbi:MAG: leucine-rich repeat domain-containing protein [Eubacterium sp.]|nr:leucine-rich repeat domain-containing protein [Eubacterium sp.]
MIDKRKTLKPKSEFGIMHRVKNLLAVSVCVTAAMLYMTAVSVWADTTGSCGDEATWVLSDEGVLTISGTGEIYCNHESGWDTDSVKEAVIESGITVIGDDTFYNNTNLESVDFPSTITEIGSCAFEQCESLTSADLSVTQVTSIGYCAFHSTGITSLTLPSTVTSIDESAFEYCPSLTAVDLSDTQITYLGQYVFNSCEALKDVTLPTALTEIGSGAFAYCTGLESITIPENVVEIWDYVFEECTSLTSIDLGNVEIIDEYAFINCTALESIIIPATVTEMGSAFRGCASLVNITVADGNQYIYIDNSGALMYKNPTYGYETVIFYPSNITASTYTIGANVIGVASGAFSVNTYLEAFEVDSDNEELIAIDGVLLEEYVDYDGPEDYDGPFRDILAYPAGKKDTSYDIPEGVMKIDAYMFMNNTYLENVTVSSILLNSIESGAFSGCINLKSIELPEGLVYIKDEAFYGCTSLEKVTIPFGVLQIYEDAFGSCTSLTDVVFEEEIIDDSDSRIWQFSIFGYAFADCTSLKNVTIHKYYWVQHYAFAGCTALEKIYCDPYAGANNLDNYTDYSPNVCIVYSDYNAVQNSDGVYFISGFSLDEGDSTDNYEYAGLYYGDETEPIDTSETVYTGFALGSVEFEAGEMGYDYIIGYKTADDNDGAVSAEDMADLYSNYALKPVSDNA